MALSVPIQAKMAVSPQKTGVILLLAVFVNFNTGCDSGHVQRLKGPSKITQTRSSGLIRKPLDGDARIEFWVTEVSGHRPGFQGKTNLPTDTKLSLVVQERAPSGFFGQSTCVVLADGSFEFILYGPDSSLNSGIYEVIVRMPLPTFQPDRVQRIIGINGENLSGPLLERSAAGSFAIGKEIVTIGGSEASHLQNERAKERIRRYRGLLDNISALEKRLQLARSNDGPRDSRHPENIAKWQQFAGPFRRDIQSYTDQIASFEPGERTIMFSGPLSDLLCMLQASSDQNKREYEKANAVFVDSLGELKKFVAESEVELNNRKEKR